MLKGPKRPPGRSNGAQSYRNIAPRRPRWPRKNLRTMEDASKGLQQPYQDVPKMVKSSNSLPENVQDSFFCSKAAQEAPKTALTQPMRAPRGPKTAQEGPRDTQHGPSEPQDDPKRGPIHGTLTERPSVRPQDALGRPQ
eukprot:7141381-Pyramimonas_sp.AAC.1